MATGKSHTWGVVIILAVGLQTATALGCVVGTGTPASCTENSLASCLLTGGIVTFDCGGSATITVTSTKVVSVNTTVDGGNLITISGGNAVGVFSVNAGVNFTVQNLTIADGLSGSPGGGGIFNGAGTLMVTNSTFSGNRSFVTYSGGPALSSSGGAIYSGGPLTIANSNFANNGVDASPVCGSPYANCRGGAIYSADTMALNNSIFSGNAPSAEYGGGIYNDGTLTVTNSTLSGNRASNGGGIWNNATLIVTNSTLAANWGAGAYGGAIGNSGTLTVTNSTFSGNHAGQRGGGIYNGSAISYVQMSTATLTVTNSTFFNNGADNPGLGAGGISNSGSAATVTNSIIGDNTLYGGNCEGTITDGGHNIDDGTTCGFTGAGCANTSGSSLCDTNPQLDSSGLGSHGGPTQTIAIESNSPAVNAGDESVCMNPPVSNLDQRGFVRPAPGEMNCSIGAYEYNSGLSCGSGVCPYPRVCVANSECGPPICPATPSSCAGAGKSKLLVKGGTRPALSWKWGKGAVAVPQTSFGNPASGGTSYALCLYDESGGAPFLAMEAALPGGAPSWAALGTSGWIYTDKTGASSGVIKALLKGGATGRPSIKLIAKGMNVPLPPPVSGTKFFDQDTAVVMQLSRTDAPNCWSSGFNPAGTTTNSGTAFKAKAP